MTPATTSAAGAGLPRETTRAVVERIGRILGRDAVLTGATVAERASHWTGGRGCLARAIIRPSSTDEVSQAMRVCDEYGQTVVTQGGLTGLVNGALASESDVVVSLERMRAVEDCDPIENTMTVQAGAILQTVQERANAVGRMFPIDLGARGSCTVGGNIATNAGGTRVIRYGMMRQQVLGLEVVLADGTIVSAMNSLTKNNAGYDVKQLFIGSEGTLGVVTRAVLRLQPLPKSECTALASVGAFDDVVTLLGMLTERLGGTLSAFEVMWEQFYRLVTTESGRHAPPLPAGSRFYVLVEALGADPERDQDRFEETLRSALESGLVTDAAVAQSSAQRQAMWAIREDTESGIRAFRPLLSFDVGLPIQHMERYVEDVDRAIRARWPARGRCVAFGHMGDGNVHVVVTSGDGDASAGAAAEAADIVYGPLRALNGTISAEHGIGLDKREYLGQSVGAAQLELMRRFKTALDPKNLLNRGKVIAEGRWKPSVVGAQVGQ